MASHKRPPRSRVVDKDARRAAVLLAELGAKVLESAPVVILLLDAQGTIQYVNPFFERLTGYRLDEIRGKDWFDTVLPGRDRERIRALFAQSLGGTSVRGNVNPIVTRAGEERDIEWTDEVLRDTEAHATCLLGRPRRDRPQGRPGRAPHERATLRRGPPDREHRGMAARSRDLDAMVVGRTLPHRRDPGRVARDAGAVSGHEFEAVYAPSVDTRGRIDGVIGVAFDVTERKRAEAELRASALAQERLVAELREADRRKNDFIAILSHELRNPLSVIRNGLYVLDRAVPGTDEARRAAGIVDRQVSQLARLVDDLLDVSRITQGKIQLQRAPLDLDDLVRAAADDHRALFSSRGIRFEVALAGAPVIVHGDAARLTQVIGNLLHNAAKFTPAGGLTRISVARDDASGCAVLHVADTGAGIDPMMIERLFQPFAQADRTLARSMGGLGLGLTLVKGLVELHGGDVSVHSEGEGRGAEFTVRLPFDRSAAELTARSACTAAPCDRRRVLVIEDNLDAAEMLASLIELEGHAVEVAHDGAAGIRIARELRPDVVLCDLGLPDMSGYDVARELDRDESLCSVLLVALSGYAAPEDVAQARAAGFDRHLAKPVALDRLRSVLETLGDPRAVPPAAGSVPQS